MPLRRLLFWLLLAAAGSFVLGFTLALLTASPPASWLVPQSPTGRPPQLVALLALVPIVIAVIVFLVVRYVRRRTKPKQS
jgi:multisubunit Na+/H+ antiporter MnhE subunit